MRRLGIWLQNRPVWLERAYQLTHVIFGRAKPIISRLGYQRVDRLINRGEEWSKQKIFDCRMCGQCILHSTGMTCPMSCPKNLRNGPCGGVRLNGNCEVIPEMRCVWVEAFERSRAMRLYGAEILHIQPPVNRELEGSSAWVNMLTGVDKEAPKAWQGGSFIPIIEVSDMWKS